MIKLVSVKTVARQLVVTLQKDDNVDERFTASVDSNTVGSKFVDETGPAKTLLERVIDAVNTAQAGPKVDVPAGLLAEGAPPEAALGSGVALAPLRKGKAR
jgi:hypothetical protein